MTKKLIKIQSIITYLHKMKDLIMAIEKEFLAMRSIDRAFASLKTDEDRERVVKWTVDKYSPSPKVAEHAVHTQPQYINQMPMQAGQRIN